MESGHAYGKALRTVKSCVGSDWCRYGSRFGSAGHRPGAALPRPAGTAQDQLGVSGMCTGVRRGARERRGRHRHRKGWNLYVGGNGGMTPSTPSCWPGPRHRDADPLHRPVPHVLHPHGDRLQRTAAVGGVAGARSRARGRVRGLTGPGRGIEAAMLRHVANYKCEWKGVLEDPDKLSRFRLLRQRPRRRRLDGQTSPSVPGAKYLCHWYSSFQGADRT